MSSVDKIQIDDEYEIIDADKNVYDAAIIMKKSGLPDLVVIDNQENKKVLGAITDFDIIEKVIAAEKAPKETLVTDIMTKINPITLASSVKNAYKIMQKKKIPFVPVADVETGKLLGVVTIQDVWQVLNEDEINDLDNQIVDDDAKSTE